MIDVNEKEGVIHLADGKKLAYAENRYQNPAFLFSTNSEDPLAMSKFQVVSGDPSYISIADGSQILEILCLLAEAFRRWKGAVPYIAIAGKHGNPCGAGFHWQSPREAIQRALWGDTTAVMGGEVITNFPIDDHLAETLYRVNDVEILDVGRKFWGLDIILAPDFSPQAIKLLGEKEARRLMANPALANAPFPEDEWVLRQVRGGFLMQKAPTFVLAPENIEFWTSKPLDGKHFADLLLAWACCYRASSNTVALANDGMLIGLGCGQQDRIACVQLCLDRANRAGNSTRGAVFASDGFFPYASSDIMLTEAHYEAITEGITSVMKTLTSTRRPPAILKVLSENANLARRLDKREGTELLADAGCIGGVVPADGKELERVKKFFTNAGMSVAFVDKLNRGFSKH